MGRTLKIGTGSGAECELEVGGDGGGAAQFVFSLHKSGSVLLNKMVKELAAEAGRCFVDIPGSLFSLGIPIREAKLRPGESLSDFEGVCFGGFREWPKQLELGLGKGTKSILLVRDPRDILVSMYFSIVKSHPLPLSGDVRESLLDQRRSAEDTSIDDWVRRESGYLEDQISTYGEVLARSAGSLKVFRYEQVIFAKEQWLEEIVGWFGWKVARGAFERIARENDMVPAAEDPGSHVRKVVPGDHREKLNPTTIGWLGERFRPLMRTFGYDL